MPPIAQVKCLHCKKIVRRQQEALQCDRCDNWHRLCDTGVIMATLTEPKSMTRAKQWSDEVEEAYRFQLAGYRDAIEYQTVQKKDIDRWPHNGYVKKLQRKDGCFYYFDKTRECPEKDISKCKLYVY